LTAILRWTKLVWLSGDKVPDVPTGTMATGLNNPAFDSPLSPVASPGPKKKKARTKANVEPQTNTKTTDKTSNKRMTHDSESLTSQKVDSKTNLMALLFLGRALSHKDLYEKNGMVCSNLIECNVLTWNEHSNKLHCILIRIEERELGRASYNITRA